MSANYETAPSTILLATHCALCARPLGDAYSVEVGMGPVCREKEEVVAAPVSPDWSAAAAAVSCAGFTSADLPGFYAGLDAGDARKACNSLVARIAAEQLSGRSAGLVRAVRALGYVALAGILSARLAEVKAGSVISITRSVAGFEVAAPFSPEFNAALRANAPGRRWDGARRLWLVPSTGKRGLWTSLQAAFAGFVVRVDGEVVGAVAAG